MKFPVERDWMPINHKLIKMCLILVIMIKIHGPKLQLLLFQPNIWLCWVLGVACGVFGLCCGMRDL